MAAERAKTFAQLQEDILRFEGFKPVANPLINSVLGPLREVFPSGAFPLGVVHEFQLDRQNSACSMAASVGFIAALISPMLISGGVMLWMSASRKVFPP